MRKLSTGLALGFALLLATTAKADSLLDFTVPAVNTGASVKYTGGTHALIGTNISITQVQGLGTPWHASDAAPFDPATIINNGHLNFTTGAGSPGWNFGGGGSITITGWIPGLVGSAINNNVVLMSGTFQSAAVTKLLAKKSTTLLLAGSAFYNSINPVLRTYFGLAGAIDWSGSFNIQIQVPGVKNVGNAFSTDAGGRVLSGDVVTGPVLPEPGTIVMAGLGGLLCLGVYGRRMLARRAS